jgi:hypothetical protein
MITEHRPRSKPPQTNAHQSSAHEKSMLVDLGLWCLSRGEWGMAQALTYILRQKGLSHE